MFSILLSLSVNSVSPDCDSRFLSNPKIARPNPQKPLHGQPVFVVVQNAYRADYPWFWTWDEKTEDFSGGEKFDGSRWNDLHFSLAFKTKARQKHEADQQEKVQLA